jgi:hypothetical protein
MRVTFIVLSALLIAVGSVIAFVGTVGIVDPAGTKLADDSDPFGTPAPRWEAAVICAFGVALIGVGVLLAVKRPRRNHGAT